MNTVSLQPFSPTELLELVNEAKLLFLNAADELPFPNQRRFSGLRAKFYQSLEEDLVENGVRAEIIEDEASFNTNEDLALTEACLQTETKVLAAMKSNEGLSSVGDINSVEWHLDYLKNLTNAGNLAA